MIIGSFKIFLSLTLCFFKPKDKIVLHVYYYCDWWVVAGHENEFCNKWEFMSLEIR